MNYTPTPSVRRLIVRPVATIALLAFTLSGFAQVSPAPDAKPDAKEVIELTPFHVNASKDVAYVASSSLAGSRLNSDLRDNAASISVLTAELLADLGATDVEQALLYSNNLQKNVGDETAGNSNGNSTVEFFSNYRIRGIKANTARDYYTWNLPTDLYNVDRVDQSRGPNSVLFGLGSAGGIINTATKKALTHRDTYAASLVFSSHNSKRGSVDINKVLIKDVLALRVNAVHEDSHAFRLFAGSKKELVDLALIWKAFARTTVRAQWETGTIDQVTTRPWGLIDIYSTWNAAGRPIRTTQATSATEGILRLAAATARVTYIEQADKLYDLRGTMITSQPASLSGKMDLTAPHSVNPEGPGASSSTDLTNYTVSLEQQVGKKTFLQVSFNHQEYDFIGYDPNNGEAHNLYGDPNANLNNAANPYAGRYFIDTNWYRRNRRETFDTLRATAATELDFGKGGRHRIAVMAERQESNFWRDEKREFLAGAPFNATPENEANAVRRRSYVTPGDWSTYRANGGDGQLLSGLVDQVSGRTLSSAWIQRNANTDDDDQTLDTLMVGDQSYFFDNRLVLTAGYRRDRVDIYDRGTTRDPSTQEIIVDYATAVPTFSTSGDTRTLGAVGHVGQGISVFYNDSASINLPIGAHRVLPNSGRAQNWKGEGSDYGLLFELADGKVSIRATRFTTASVGETDFRNVIGIVTNRNIRVLAALQAAGQVTASEVTARTVNVNTARGDRDSSGYEFSLVANPTKQWRLTANYSLTDAIETNIMPEVRTWADEAIAFWSTKNTSLVTSANISVTQEIANLRQNILDQVSAEGRASVGNRRKNFNVFSRYDFSSRLAGFYVGGGWRYQGPIVMGADTTGNLLFGNSTTMADALIGYRGKTRQRFTYSIQLNVSNVFDNTDPLIFRKSADGTFATRLRLVEGRAYNLSTSIKF